MIRPIRPTDADILCQIYNHYIEETVISFEEEPVSPVEMRERIRLITATHPWLVDEREGQVLGYAYAGYWEDRPAYRLTAQTAIYLAPEATGQGIGFQLYSDLIALLQKQGLHSLLAGIALPNPGSVALHEKLGFSKVAHYSQIGFKQGRWIDVGRWQLLL